MFCVCLQGEKGIKGDTGAMGLPVSPDAKKSIKRRLTIEIFQGPMGFRGDSGGSGPVGKAGVPVSHRLN